MVKQSIHSKDFDLRHTVESGQFFQFEKRGKGYVIWSGREIFYVEQEGERLWFENIDAKKLVSFFSLDMDYRAIVKQLSRDKHLAFAIKSVYGLRIMRQDFFECLIAFVCSANSNIPKITKNVRLLSRFFGTPVKFMGELFYLFPRPGRICNPSKVVEAKTGFRARFICQINSMVDEEYCSHIKTLPYSEQKAMLMKLPGVGPKVADCVLLFSLGRNEAFPIDVWIRRTINSLYFPNSPKKDKDILDFARRQFGEYAGYANQFLFHYSRTLAQKTL